MQTEGGRREGDAASAALAGARETFDVEVRCQGTPVVDLVGPAGAFLFTNAGELLAVGPEARVVTPFAAGEPAPRTQVALASAATLDTDGAPVLGTPSGEVAWYRGGAWEVRAHGAAVLAMGATRAGVVAGDAAGKITVFDGRRVAELFAGEPVVEILGAGACAGVLGAEGGLWVTRWPGDEDAPLAPVDAGRVGRAFGLFAGAEGRIGVLGARRVGLVDAGDAARGRVVAASPDLGEVRAVVALGEGAGYAALGDDGALAGLDAALRVRGPIALPRRSAVVAGVRAAGDGALLAWTGGGELFVVRRDGAARRLAGEDVVLAYAMSPSFSVVVHAIDGGVRVRTLRWS